MDQINTLENTNINIDIDNDIVTVSLFHCFTVSLFHCFNAQSFSAVMFCVQLSLELTVDS